MFNRHMLEDEQTEKRYLRLIQEVASDAMRGDGKTFTARLAEVLGLILESIAAQSAVLLLYEAESNKLLTAVSAGVAHEALQQFVVSFAPTSFAAQVAKAEHVSQGDADSRELVVPDFLKACGIHVLLGARLPPRHKLLAVAYVGFTKPERVSPRQVRRLESLGAWLLLHLDNAQLYAGLKEKVRKLQAERAIREQFVSILAHDLRGPLAAARLIAQMLIRHPERMEERRDLAIKLAQTIDRAEHMIRDLLDANRIRAGNRLPLRLDACDLGAVADEVVAELSALHGERIVLKAEEQVRGIWSAEELRRAVWNLATNAVKYGAPNQPITVTVGHADGWAKVAVHNHGRVIAKEEQARLFEPFARAQSLPADAQAGWGLGLTLVRGCAEAHGGRVEVESDAAAGTTFTLLLPLDSRPYQPQNEPAQSPE
jgi:signal transduction histidine kinase